MKITFALSALVTLVATVAAAAIKDKYVIPDVRGLTPRPLLPGEGLPRLNTPNFHPTHKKGVYPPPPGWGPLKNKNNTASPRVHLNAHNRPGCRPVSFFWRIQHFTHWPTSETLHAFRIAVKDVYYDDIVIRKTQGSPSWDYFETRNSDDGKWWAAHYTEARKDPFSIALGVGTDVYEWKNFLDGKVSSGGAYKMKDALSPITVMKITSFALSTLVALVATVSAAVIPDTPIPDTRGRTPRPLLPGEGLAEIYPNKYPPGHKKPVNPPPPALGPHKNSTTSPQNSKALAASDCKPSTLYWRVQRWTHWTQDKTVHAFRWEVKNAYDGSMPPKLTTGKANDNFYEIRYADDRKWWVSHLGEAQTPFSLNVACGRELKTWKNLQDGRVHYGGAYKYPEGVWVDVWYEFWTCVNWNGIDL
ncbi:hypothetical protein BGX23_008927 [Mortierella sp. AD031]|nr:hypothetical protein BGX23_008927 [Mortierella sp. AD031]